MDKETKKLKPQDDPMQIDPAQSQSSLPGSDKSQETAKLPKPNQSPLQAISNQYGNSSSPQKIPSLKTGTIPKTSTNSYKEKQPPPSSQDAPRSQIFRTSRSKSRHRH